MNFHCPSCGSFMFGSSLNADGTWTRHCHGNEMWQCEFSFHQDDDHLYFKEEENPSAIEYYEYVRGFWEGEDGRD